MRTDNINTTTVMIFKVLKPFYTHSNKQNYKVDETIELTKVDALGMLNDGYIEEVKETIKKSK